MLLADELRLLIKFGYLGWLFTGYQSGNGEKNVEDTILKVLRENHIADSIYSAARTDRNVSAVSNAIALDTEEGVSKVLGILNSSIDGMFFHSFAQVQEGFNPRHCDYKIYRYFLPENECGPYLKNGLSKFRGTHDFRNFCRLDSRNPTRTINSIRTRKSSGFMMVDFKARSFLWNQIRNIMAFAVEHSYSPESVDPFALTERYSKLLDPHPLVLLELVYPGIEFTPLLGRSKTRQLRKEMRSYRIRNQVVQAFAFLDKE